MSHWHAACLDLNELRERIRNTDLQSVTRSTYGGEDAVSQRFPAGEGGWMTRGRTMFKTGMFDIQLILYIKTTLTVCRTITHA